MLFSKVQVSLPVVWCGNAQSEQFGYHLSLKFLGFWKQWFGWRLFICQIIFITETTKPSYDWRYFSKKPMRYKIVFNLENRFYVQDKDISLQLWNRGSKKGSEWPLGLLLPVSFTQYFTACSLPRHHVICFATWTRRNVSWIREIVRSCPFSNEVHHRWQSDSDAFSLQEMHLI